MPPRDISVVIPAKDAAPFLDATFASLRQQADDLRDLDIVFVDDGSTDHTAEILQRQRRLFPRLRVVRHERARGLADARNAGIAIADSDIIAFLDGDDWLRAGHLTRINQAIRELDVDFVRCDHIKVFPQRRLPQRAPFEDRHRPLSPREGILPAGASTMVDYPYAWAGAFHRRLLDRDLLLFPAGFQTAEDRSWIWDLHLHAESFAVVDAPGICYRREVGSSLTQIADDRQLWFIDAFERIFAMVAADRDADRLMPKAVRNWLGILAHHLGRAELMTPAVRTQLRRRTLAVTETIPRDDLLRAYRQIKPARRARLLRSVPTLGPLPRRLREVLA